MSSANEKQVGGDHYKKAGDMQHWDMVAALHLGYFEGQATKYLTRHRSKKGREDCEKGLHMLEKLYEVCVVRNNGTQWINESDSVATRRHTHAWGSYTWRLYMTANGLTENEVLLIRSIAEWQYMPELKRIIVRVQAYIAATYDGEAGPGYVQQDRGAA